MKKTIAILTISLFIAVSGILSAQEQAQLKPMATPRITKKQVHQKVRIGHGVKSGKLTRRETAKLQKEQAKIRHDKKDAKADGKVTPEERQKIRREQRKSSRDIYRLKHNNRNRK